MAGMYVSGTRSSDTHELPMLAWADVDFGPDGPLHWLRARLVGQAQA